MKKLLILVPSFVVILALSKMSFAQDVVAAPEGVAPGACAEAVTPPPVPHAYPPYPYCVPVYAACRPYVPQAMPCCAMPYQAMPCMVPAGCPYGCYAAPPEQKSRLGRRFAGRFAQPAPFQYPPPYQFPTPYPMPAAFPPATGAFPATAVAPAPQMYGGYGPGYYPTPVTTTTAGRNAHQRSSAPIVINFMSLFRSPRTTQYDPYAGYYAQYPPYPYPAYATPALDAATPQ